MFYILASMIFCRLIVTLSGGLLSHIIIIKKFQHSGQTHMVKFSKKMCTLDMISSAVAFCLVLFIVGYIDIIMPAIFLLKVTLIILAEFIEQLTIFAFERIFNLRMVNGKLINAVAIKPHIKRCFKNFYNGLIYDFVFYLAIAVALVVFNRGTIYLVVLGVSMAIRTLSLTPPKLLL